MNSFWNYVRHVALALVLLIAVAFLLGLAAPYISDSVRRIAAEFDTGRGKSGLIYVESPEVYTRQRLVNDRYLQDAWLRGKLEEIDDETTVWIDAVRFDQRRAAMSLGTASGDADEENVKLPDASEVQPSFEDKFDLQRNARDKIRQMILENALDDRHDLSGNTVFGLKFDTAILPGSTTELNPTVVVTMKANPLEELTPPVQQFTPRFSRNAEAAAADTCREDPTDDHCLVKMMDLHFDRWRQNLEERLNRQRAVISERPEINGAAETETSQERDARHGACLRPQAENDEMLESHLCSFPILDGGTVVGTLSMGAEEILREGIDLGESAQQYLEDQAELSTGGKSVEEKLEMLFSQREAVDGALNYVLRLPSRKIRVGDWLRDTLISDARAFCSRTGRDIDLWTKALKRPTGMIGPLPPAARVEAAEAANIFVPSSFRPEIVPPDQRIDIYLKTQRTTSLRDFAAILPVRVVDLPEPWGPLFGLELQWRVSEEPRSCGVDIDMTLRPREVLVTLMSGTEPPWAIRPPEDETKEETTQSQSDTVAEPNASDAGESGTEIPPRRPDWLAPTEGLDDWLVRKGWFSLPCNTKSCEDNGETLWVNLDREQAEVTLDAESVSALIESHRSGGEFEGSEVCFDSFGPYRQTEDARFCRPGANFSLRFGAYHFLRKMTEVESYTYAAFPRGDVSGVVRETSEAEGASGGGAAGGLQGAFDFVSRSGSRSTETEPRLINFAAGDSNELFDFGWSVVKEGEKHPMIASQLVLVSVPAFIDRIQLEVRKGFLDIDKVPLDWDAEDVASALADQSAGSGCQPLASSDVPTDETERRAMLEQRGQYLFSDFECRQIELKVPPDYGALDSIVIGNNVRGGPTINEARMDQDCYEVIDHRTREDKAIKRLSLTIHGERLWRSTVVTLNGQKASVIEVMPDMRGILATFDGFALVPNANKETPALLTIWTSEGSTEREVKICARAVPPNGEANSGSIDP